MKKLLTFLLLITAFTSSAQVYQNDPSYGRSIDRYEVRKDLGIPTFCGVPSINSTVTNKAKIAYDSCGHKFYVYDPSTETWGQVTGGGVIIDPGVDSITYHNNQLCQWVSGVSTCYFLNKFYDSTALNFDSTKILHFNSGNLVDSVLIPTGTIHIIQDGAGETNIVRVEDSTRLHFATLKNTDDITISKASDSAVLLQFTHPHYTKDQVDSIAATLTASGITRAELIDTADNKVNKTDVSGGTINQVLKKNSSTDYDWSWQDESSGVSQSVISDTLKNYANSGSITTDNVVYSTPIALSVANHLMTGSFALKSQSAYTLFGNRTSGSATPTFFTIPFIDSVKLSTDTLFGRVNGTWQFQFKSPAFANWKTNGSAIYTDATAVGIGISSPISKLHIVSNNLGQTSTTDSSGIILDNQTAATGSVKQNSPALVFKGSGWNSTTSSATDSRIRIVVIPQTGTTASPGFPSMVIQHSIDGGATYTSNVANFSYSAANGPLLTIQMLNVNNQVTAGTISGASVNSTISGMSSTLSKNITTGTNSYDAIRAIPSITISGGNNTINSLNLSGAINSTGGTTLLRGVYYNPTFTSATGITNVAFQNEIGDNLFGTTSGSVGIGPTTTIAPSLILQTTSTTQASLPVPKMTKTQRNAISSPVGGAQVIVTGETGGEYLSWYNSSTSAWVKVTSTAD